MRIPTNLAIPYSLHDLDRNLGDVRVLLDLAKARNGPRLTRRDAEVLTRSAVVLICAAWESFVEELALDVLAFSITRIRGELGISGRAREVANRALKYLDVSKPHNLLVDLRRHRDQLLGLFNTPKAANIDSLYRRAFGIEQITDTWRWGRTRPSSIRLQLDRYVTLRSDIAHRTRAPNRIKQLDALHFSELTGRLSWLMCNAMRAWLSYATASAPWGELPAYAAA